MQSQWPETETVVGNNSLVNIDFILEVVSEVRSLRGLFSLSSPLKLPLLLASGSDKIKVLQDHQIWLLHLARLESIAVSDDQTERNQCVPFVIGQNTFFLKVGHLINLDAAFKILEKKLETLVHEMQHLQKKLENMAYQKAKPEAWEDDKTLLQTKQHEQDRLKMIFKNISKGLGR